MLRSLVPHQEYIAPDGSLNGANIDECIVPSRMGIDLVNLSRGMGNGESPAKKAKK